MSVHTTLFIWSVVTKNRVFAAFVTSNSWVYAHPAPPHTERSNTISLSPSPIYFLSYCMLYAISCIMKMLHVLHFFQHSNFTQPSFPYKQKLRVLEYPLFKTWLSTFKKDCNKGKCLKSIRLQLFAKPILPCFYINECGRTLVLTSLYFENRILNYIGSI